MPNLRMLDFQKVKLKEKLQAKKIFDSVEGKEIIQKMISRKFNEIDEEEFIKGVQKIKQDETNKQKIYVRIVIII